VKNAVKKHPVNYYLVYDAQKVSIPTACSLAQGFASPVNNNFRQKLVTTMKALNQRFHKITQKIKNNQRNILSKVKTFFSITSPTFQNHP
jgi:hypothetical protein